MTQMTSQPGQAPTGHEFPSMMRLISGYWISCCLYVVAKLGIADLLNEKPVSAASLAQQTQVNEDYLYRVLRALCGVGVFQETAEKSFTQTSLSAMLKTNSAGSMRDITIMMGEQHYQAWGHLLEGVQTGGRPFEYRYQMPVFEFYEQNPDAGEIFNRAMTSFSSIVPPAVTSVYDFSKFKTLVDVGGGHGQLLAAILQQFPQLHGVLFDLPHVVQGAVISEALTPRLSVSAGDFFQSTPAGGDAYILSRVVHDWDDARCQSILSNIHAGMNAQGTLLVIEHVVAPSLQKSQPRYSVADWLDINMLVMTEGGRERTRDEFEALFNQAGFELTQVIPTPAGVSIIEGVKR